MAFLSLRYSRDVQKSFVNDFTVKNIKERRQNNQPLRVKTETVSALRYKEECAFNWLPLLWGTSNKVCPGGGPGILKSTEGESLFREAQTYCVAKT